MTLLYLVAAWTGGIFLASSGKTPVNGWIALGAASLVLALLNRHSRTRRLGLVCLAFFALGAGRYAWATRKLSSDHIVHYADTGYVILTGVVSQDPDVRDQYVNLRIRVESVEQDENRQPAEGVVLVQAPRYGDYAYGDRVNASGMLLTPPEFDDFSYRDYLARSGIHAMIPNAQVEVVARDQGQPWSAALYTLKARAQQTIDRSLPSPQGPLLEGILLGIDSEISSDVRQAFNRTGTAHLIAISGSNIIIVIRVLMGLLTPGLGKKRAGWATMLGVAAYTVLVGANPAVVRAAIMGGLLVLASQTGRRAHGLTSLAFAVWLMTLWNPLTLWDIGFQLSVAATAGLVLFVPTMSRWLEAALRRGFSKTTARQAVQWLSEPLIVGLAAQITTTPLVLFYFGRLSLASFLANLLVVPVQAYIMILGWLTVVAGLIWPALGEPLAWITWIPLSYTLGIVRSLDRFEWAAIDFELSTQWAWAAYGIILVMAVVIIQHPDDRAALFRRVRQRFTTGAVMAGGLILVVLVWSVALTQPDNQLHVWFLNVGHGHAVLIQTPTGAHILIDGGPNPTRLKQAVGDALPFWEHHLDLLIVTQPKPAAVNALPALLGRYDVALALTNGQTANTDEYAALVRHWSEEQVQVIPVTAGYRVQTGDGVMLEILHPQVPPPPDAEPEDAGLVVRVQYGDASFLITPDLNEQAGLEMIRAGWYIGSTVFELSARGSAAANSDALLQAVQPQVATVIVGSGSRSPLPAPEVIARLEAISPNMPIYRTDRHGTIEIRTDGHTLWVYSGR